MRYEIRSIGMWPFIKVSFFFNLVVGFVFGLLYALFAGFIMTIMSRLSQFQPSGFDFELEPMPIGIVLVVLPILLAVMAAVFYTMIGVVLVLIYNLIAKLAGGYELDLELAAVGGPPMPGGQPMTAYTGAPSYVPPPPPGSQPQSTPPPSSAPESPPLPPPPGSDDQRTDRGDER